MTFTEILFFCALLVASTLITIGFFLLSSVAGFIAAGLLVAGLATLFLVEVE